MTELTDHIKSKYIEAFDKVGDTVADFKIRRYSGSPGSRTTADYAARARLTGYEPHQIAGSVQQGDRKLIVYADDLVDAGLVGKVLPTDKALVRGKELAIIAVDDSTRRVSGVLIAYELQARG